jgi:chorismate mutase / prephenate dehydratase
MGTDAARDSVVEGYRDRISAVDAEILDAFNRRVALVRELHAHKRERGYPMRDQARERELIGSLAAANPGPLSAHGLERLYRLLVEVCTEEAARQD